MYQDNLISVSSQKHLYCTPNSHPTNATAPRDMDGTTLEEDAIPQPGTTHIDSFKQIIILLA
jgi:hypothetical protein